LTSDEVQAACTDVRQRFVGIDPFAEACAAIEQFSGEALGRRPLGASATVAS